MGADSVLTFLGALGGAAVFLGAVITVIRGIFRQVNATEANTVALDNLRKTVDGLDSRLNRQGERIAKLEGRQP
jgi:hypothetical protein